MLQMINTSKLGMGVGGRLVTNLILEHSLNLTRTNVKIGLTYLITENTLNTF